MQYDYQLSYDPLLISEQIVGNQRLSSNQYSNTYNLIQAALASENSHFLTAFDKTNPAKAIATGYVTKSLHDYSHWGINLLAVSPLHEHSHEVQKLVSDLIQYIETTHQRVIKNPLSEQLEIVRQYPTPFLAISARTTYPDLFIPHGFTSVHKHSNSIGQDEHLIFRISGGPTEYHSIEFSQPSIHPFKHQHVRILESKDEILQAAQIVAEEWGKESAHDFLIEHKIISNMPGSAFYAVFNDQKICGVGAIIKALHDESLWSRAWIVVSKDDRGKGFARDLIQGLLFHADEQHPNFSDGPMIMEGFTYIPDYYRKFGNQPIARITTANERGFPTWTARITHPPENINLASYSFT